MLWRSWSSTPRSLSENLDVEGTTELGDLIADVRPSPDAVAAVAADIARLLSVLDERDRQILTLRFGLDGHRQRTFTELARIFGLTPQRVRQIHVGAIRKLREAASA